MKTLSILMSVMGMLASRPMYCKARSMPLRRTLSASVGRIGHVASTGSTISGDVPQGYLRPDIPASISITVSNCAPSLNAGCASIPRLIPRRTGGRIGTTAEIVNGFLVDRNHARAGAASIACCRPSCGPSTDRSRMVLAPNSMAWQCRPPCRSCR